MYYLQLTILFMMLFISSALADEYYLGQWNWVTVDGESFWQAPSPQFLTGVIDLRSIPQQSLAGGTPQGWAIFSYSQAVSGLFSLSNNLDKKLTNPIKTKIQTELGITLAADNVRDALWEILTVKADPTGQKKWKPLRPDHNNILRINLGNSIVKEARLIPGKSKEWTVVLAAMQEGYRDIVKYEKPSSVARMLDLWEKQYGIPYQVFIPRDSVQIAALPHHTTITDNFNRADADPLGTSSEGWSWTELLGDIDIVSNTARTGTLTGRKFARAESNLSSSDHSVQAELVSLNRLGATIEGQICARMKDDSNFYVFNYSDSASDVSNLFKRVAGVFTQLGSNSSLTVSIPDTIKIQADGSTISTYINGTVVHTQNDTAINEVLTTGIASNNSQVGNYAGWDDFTATDILVFRPNILSDFYGSDAYFN